MLPNGVRSQDSQYAYFGLVLIDWRTAIITSGQNMWGRLLRRESIVVAFQPRLMVLTCI
jgi:hypothetical protein